MTPAPDKLMPRGRTSFAIDIPTLQRLTMTQLHGLRDASYTISSVLSGLMCQPRFAVTPGVYDGAGEILDDLCQVFDALQEATVNVAEKKRAADPSDATWRERILVSYKADMEDIDGVREVLSPAATSASIDTIDAADRLNEGTALVQGAFLALQSPIFGDGKDDSNAVSETVYQALAKLQAAKAALGQ